jgi:hypothetical protein
MLGSLFREIFRCKEDSVAPVGADEFVSKTRKFLELNTRRTRKPAGRSEGQISF